MPGGVAKPLWLATGKHFQSHVAVLQNNERMDPVTAPVSGRSGRNSPRKE
jgi:hypothetical protein